MVRHKSLDLILVPFSQYEILETVVVVNIFDGIDLEDRCLVSTRRKTCGSWLTPFPCAQNESKDIRWEQDPVVGTK